MIINKNKSRLIYKINNFILKSGCKNTADLLIKINDKSLFINNKFYRNCNSFTDVEFYNYIKDVVATGLFTSITTDVNLDFSKTDLQSNNEIKTIIKYCKENKINFYEGQVTPCKKKTRLARCKNISNKKASTHFVL